MDKRKISLIKNTAILGIGNFSSKILVFLLVPLYTYYLKPTDYGKIDIYLTFLSMLYIVVSMQSIESAFRFIQDCKSDNERTIIFSNALITAITGIGVFTVIIVIIGEMMKFEYTLIFILFVSSSVVSNLILHTLRGMKRMKTYAVIGVISTVVLVAGNVLFIAGIGLGALSLLIAPIVTNLFIILVLLFTTDILKYCRISAFSKELIKEQLKYSLPLVPHAIGIWLLASIGRFILLFYYGAAEVGLLAFTLKFPLLLGTMNSIFFLAWQTSAISEYHSSDKNKFASEVFNHFSKFLLAAILIILPLMKIAIFTIMGEAYRGTWVYIPVFFLGVIFNSYAQYYSMGFFGAKKTNQVFYSVIISCVVYAVLGLLLAKALYILGVGIAYSVAEFVYWLYMKKKVEPYMKISINVRQQLSFLILIMGSTLIYYIGGLGVQAITVLVTLIMVIVANRNLISGLIIPLKNSLRKRIAN